MYRFSSRAALLASTTVVAVALAAGQAAAQTRAEGAVEEIIVTATRREETINKVPMSISAQTAEALEQRGIKNVQDLAQATPGFTRVRAAVGNSFDLTIRGIYSPVFLAAAPTSAVFIDETSIQQRGGATLGSNLFFATPVPYLNDLERVEVLKGPQGTLFGGSALGGAVRFISPRPSFTDSSGLARVEASLTEHGSLGYEALLAAGGPIRENLAFRASVFGKRVGGWVDHVNMYNQQVIAKNTNDQNIASARLALRWKASDKLEISPALYISNDKRDDTDQIWLSAPAAFVKQGTIGGTITTNGVQFVVPPHTFGGFTQIPLIFGPYQTGSNIYTDTNLAVPGSAPTKADLIIPTLTIDYDEGGKVALHSVSSYVYAYQRGGSFGFYGQNGGSFTAGPVLSPNLTGNCGQGVSNPPNYAGGCLPYVIPGYPQANQRHFSSNRRESFSQELRFTTNFDGPLNLVGGAYYGHMDVDVLLQQQGDDEARCRFVTGLQQNCYATFLGIGPMFIDGSPGGAYNNIQYFQQDDRELAFYLDGTYRLTNQLRVSAGVRYSRLKNRFYDKQAGPHAAGTPFGFVGTPANPFPTNVAACPGGLAVLTDEQSLAVARAGCPFIYVNEVQKDNPITPRFTLTYEPRPDSMVFLTAAKGFRSGGGNNPINPGICAADLAALGLSQSPGTFKSDSLWNFEGGVKTRVAGRTQVNVSAFLVDWNDPQNAVQLGICGRNYIGNAGKAVIKGVDLQIDSRPLPGLTLSGQVTYQDGQFKQDVFAFNSTTRRLFYDGEELPFTPKWSYILSASYEFQLTSSASAYIRGDYSYKGKYVRGNGPGNQGYDPVTRVGEPQEYATARMGVRRDNIDVAFFVRNLTGSKDLLNLTHPSNQAQQFGATFQPREFGLSASLRY